MLPRASTPRIVIRKNKKARAHAAHGGAWKIAYADFVTAMMAFFLLMWLLGSTAKGELEGIASYFSNPVKLSIMGGDGAGNGGSILPGGGPNFRNSAGTSEGNNKFDHEILARVLQQRIREAVQRNVRLAEIGPQLRFEPVVQGLYVEIADVQMRPMFDTGSAMLKPYMREVLQAVGAALAGLEHRVAIAGHTDARPYGRATEKYSNWELSIDRANAARREMVAGGMDESTLIRVEGRAASQLLVPSDPLDERNRRIGILIVF